LCCVTTPVRAKSVPPLDLRKVPDQRTIMCSFSPFSVSGVPPQPFPTFHWLMEISSPFTDLSLGLGTRYFGNKHGLLLPFSSLAWTTGFPPFGVLRRRSLFRLAAPSSTFLLFLRRWLEDRSRLVRVGQVPSSPPCRSASFFLLGPALFLFFSRLRNSGPFPFFSPHFIA